MPFDESYKDKIGEKVFQEARDCKAQGVKIFGSYCAFTPKELITAAGGIPVSLCGESEKPIERAEQHLPRTLCPLIKSSYGHALADSCPYFHSADYLVADTTCDGKKKMFELMSRIKPIHIMQLPQTVAGDASLNYWVEEVKRFIAFLESCTGNKITEDKIIAEIERHNALRTKKRELCELNTGEVPLVTGNEIDAILWPSMFQCNPDQRMRELHEAITQLKQRRYDESFLKVMRRKPRILITGCPITNKKLLKIVEASGAVVAAQENCGGLKVLSFPVPLNSDPLRALAQSYLQTRCSCMTPNTARLDLIEDIIDRYHIDGVVELIWESCLTYGVEVFLVQERLQEKCGTPYLQIRTDYSENDQEQIRTRIEAFLELVTPAGNRRGNVHRRDR